LSEAELSALLTYVKNRADSAREKGTTRAVIDELIILLLLNAGLRCREVCNLSVRDLPPKPGENALWVRGAKGKLARKVDIDEKTVKCLERFVRLYRKGSGPDEPLLLSERGNRLGYISLYSKVKNIGSKVGLWNLHPNMLRRTYIVRLYDAERDLRFVQQQAGHASPKTTAKYVRTVGERGPSPRCFSQAGFTADGVRGGGRSTTCEGCGGSILEGSGTKIDSGQILCGECLNYLRNV
jgi:integrase